ncbi:MAG: hypothetical protein QM756_17120 [Polyangiaceae bacterium]
MRLNAVSKKGSFSSGRATARRLALACLLGASLPRVAAAQDDATTGIARERFKEGVQFFDQKQYEKARAAFLQAYALKRHSAVLLNLAQSELRSGHEADGAKHFAQFLREAKEATDAERQSAEAGLTAAKAVVAEVTVNVDEDGAVVSVDGNSEGQSPLPGPVFLTPGPHSFSAKKEGKEVSSQVNAVAGQSASTSLRLRKAAAAPPPAAEDGEKPEPKEKPEKEPEASEAEPEHSEPARGEAPASEGPERRRLGFFEWAAHSPIAWVGGGLTAAGVGGGIAFALGSKRNYDNADSVRGQIGKAAQTDSLTSTQGICTQAGLLSISTAKGAKRAGEYQNACEKYNSYVENGDSMKKLSIVSWVVAGVAAVGTVTVYLLDGTAPAESAKRSQGVRAQLVPVFTNHEQALFVQGSF